MENENPVPRKSNSLRNLTLTAILAGTAVMGYDVFKGDPLRYENKPAVARPVDSEAPEKKEDESGKYLSIGLAGLALVVGTALIARKVKKPWLLYTLTNDYLAKRKQHQEQK